MPFLVHLSTPKIDGLTDRKFQLFHLFEFNAGDNFYHYLQNQLIKNVDSI